jgi:hypothetical protein
MLSSLATMGGGDARRGRPTAQVALSEEERETLERWARRPKSAQALALRLMKAEKAWDHDAFFDYCDRWMYEDETEALKKLKEDAKMEQPDWAHGAGAPGLPLLITTMMAIWILHFPVSRGTVVCQQSIITMATILFPGSPGSNLL